MARRSFRYDPTSKTLVEIHRDRASSAPAVIDDLTPFISPIDGTVISSRSQLRDYMGEHDVVPYEEAKTQKREEDRYEKARDDRALRERLWEGVDRALRTGRGPNR